MIDNNNNTNNDNDNLKNTYNLYYISSQKTKRD